MDSAKGWAGTIRFNDRLWQQFQAFYARPDTFSLGVCNGCQLMALLGWVPATGPADAALLEDAAQPRFVHNASGRFESRWAMVRIEEDSPAIMLRGMGGAQIGVWCAHGEGQAKFPSEQVQQRVMADSLAPIRWVGGGWVGGCSACMHACTHPVKPACLAAVGWQQTASTCAVQRMVTSPRPACLPCPPICTAGTATARGRPPCSTPSTPTARPRASPRCAPPTGATWR